MIPAAATQINQLGLCGVLPLFLMLPPAAAPAASMAAPTFVPLQ
jgi:hypothetical protein